MFFLVALLGSSAIASVGYSVWRASSYLYDRCCLYNGSERKQLINTIECLEDRLIKCGVELDDVDMDTSSYTLIKHANNLTDRLKVLDFCKTIIILIELSYHVSGRVINAKETKFLQNIIKQEFNNLLDVYKLISQSTYLGIYDTLIRLYENVMKQINSKAYALSLQNATAYLITLDKNTHPIDRAEAILCVVIARVLLRLQQTKNLDTYKSQFNQEHEEANEEANEEEENKREENEEEYNEEEYNQDENEEDKSEESEREESNSKRKKLV